jgi:hypothetical protein
LTAKTSNGGYHKKDDDGKRRRCEKLGRWKSSGDHISSEGLSQRGV